MGRGMVRCPWSPAPPPLPCSSVNQHTGRNFTVDDSEAAKKKFAEEFNFEENLKKLDLTKVCGPPPLTGGSPTVSEGGFQRTSPWRCFSRGRRLMVVVRCAQAPAWAVEDAAFQMSPEWRWMRTPPPDGPAHGGGGGRRWR